MKSRLVKALSIAGLALLLVAGGMFWITHQDETDQPSSQKPIVAQNAAPIKSSLESPDLAPPQSQLGTCSINTPCESPTPAADIASAAQSSDTSHSPLTFHELLIKVSNELPTLQSLALLKIDEAHHASQATQMIQKTRARLAPINESIQRDFSLTAAGHQFYADCFRRGDLPFEIRALCLKEARHLNEKPLANGTTSPPENVTNLPLEIISLADQLSSK